MPTPDLPVWFLSLLLAPFGLVLGSFANVLIHRLPQEDEAERNVVTRPSHCPACKARIRPWHNIPLLGWVILLGRCRDCGVRIPFRYPLVEALGGLLFAGSVWVAPFGTLIWVKLLLCFYALLVLFFTDLTEMILPDAIQKPLMVLGVLLTLPQLAWPARETFFWAASGHDVLSAQTFANGLQTAPAWNLPGPLVDWKDSLLGLAVGYGAPLAVNQLYKWIRKSEGIGMGDFKMLAWLGAFWGWAPMLGILFGGALLGAAVGVPLMVLRKASAKTMLPFGCAMAVATPVVVFYGPALWSGYMALAR